MPHPDLHGPRSRVLDGIGQGFGDREVGRGLDRRLQPPRQVDVQVGPERSVQSQRPDGVGEPTVGQHRWVDAADQVTQVHQGP